MAQNGTRALVHAVCRSAAPQGSADAPMDGYVIEVSLATDRGDVVPAGLTLVDPELVDEDDPDAADAWGDAIAVRVWSGTFWRDGPTRPVRKPGRYRILFRVWPGAPSRLQFRSKGVVFGELDLARATSFRGLGVFADPETALGSQQRADDNGGDEDAGVDPSLGAGFGEARQQRRGKRRGGAPDRKAMLAGVLVLFLAIQGGLYAWNLADSREEGTPEQRLARRVEAVRYGVVKFQDKHKRQPKDAAELKEFLLSGGEEPPPILGPKDPPVPEAVVYEPGEPKFTVKGVASEGGS